MTALIIVAAVLAETVAGAWLLVVARLARARAMQATERTEVARIAARGWEIRHQLGRTY